MNDDFTPPASPWPLFAQWFALAQQHEPAYPDCMILATVGADGMPSARAVLMKAFDDKGIEFHTNRDSRKGHELAAHDKASICFYWKSIQRQIRVEGAVEKISDADSDAYFATRPRGSQIGAWASLQSQKLENREMLEDRVKEIEKKYEGGDVPRPPHWGGYRLIPHYFEFWQERLYRLHDRITYSRHDLTYADDRVTYKDANGAWQTERLYP